MKDLIAIVDENDRITGFEDKLKVHELGILHRAYSIFVLNKKNELLLQKRASIKYHSAGLWTNTCCSHLPKGKGMVDAAKERLKEEMGFECKLSPLFVFRYRIDFQNGLIENEIDHIFTALWEGIPSPNPMEVDEYKWLSLDLIKADLDLNPEHYTFWFREMFELFQEKIKE